MEITIELDARDLRRRLDRLERAGENLLPALRDISRSLADGAEDAFDRETSPAGAAWPDLRPTTIALRARRRKWPGKKLQVSSTLAGSIMAAWSRSTATAGTNLIYARTQQFGVRKGEFGSTKRGPIPWGAIPARPFLGQSDGGDEAILDILEHHFRRAAGV